MATIQSPNHAAPRVLATGPKLRDSCHACAAAKLRCSKTKPTCARCAKRGTACEYVASKRAGRTHSRAGNHNHHNHNHNRGGGGAEGGGVVRQTTSSLSTSSASSSTFSASSGTTVAASPDVISVSLEHYASDYPTISPEFLSSRTTGPASIATPAASLPQFDDLFGSPGEFPLLDPLDGDINPTPNDPQSFSFLLDHPDAAALLLGSNFNSTSVSDLSLSKSQAPASSITNLSPIQNPQTPPDSRPSTTTGTPPPPPNLFPSDSSGCCLFRGLSLLKQLFPSGPPGCAAIQAHDYDDDPIPPPVQSIITKNRQTIEAIISMLQCPCSEDPYILSIMSLVMFRVLSSYTAAARETATAAADPQHKQSHPRVPPSMGGFAVEDDEKGRIMAQLVLSELHRAQRLISMLSQRLRAQQAPAGGGLHSQTSAMHRIASASFSNSLLEQYDVELRGRLRAVSAEIVEILRQG